MRPLYLPDEADIAAQIAGLAVQRVAEALHLADDAAPRLAAARAEVERDIKLRFGGDAVHIRQPRTPTADRAAAVQRDYRAGVPVPHLLDRHGVSRATLYRYLKRG